MRTRRCEVRCSPMRPSAAGTPFERRIRGPLDPQAGKGSHLAPPQPPEQGSPELVTLDRPNA